MENEIQSGAFTTIQNPYDLHVIVCTNTRAGAASGHQPVKQSCGPLGAEEIRAELKTWLYAEVKNRPSLNGKVKIRVNGSGCLDFCKQGIVVAIYPQSEFMLFVKNSAESIALVKSQILAKLAELEK